MRYTAIETNTCLEVSYIPYLIEFNKPPHVHSKFSHWYLTILGIRLILLKMAIWESCIWYRLFPSYVTGLKQWQMKIIYYYFTSYHALQHLTNTSIPSQLILSIVWGIWIIHVFSILCLNWNKRYGSMILLLELT